MPNVSAIHFPLLVVSLPKLFVFDNQSLISFIVLGSELQCLLKVKEDLTAQPQSEANFCFIVGQNQSSFNLLFACIFTFYILYIALNQLVL